MEARDSSEHLDGSLEQNDGGGAVHVVVAVKQDRLARGYGSLQPCDSRVHAQHEEGIVKVSNFWIEEGECFRWLGDAAGHQQFGQHLRQACGFGQRGGLVRMRLGEDPALAKQLPRRNLPRKLPLDFNAESAHCGYSSSSS